MARPGWYRSHRLRHGVIFHDRFETDEDRVEAAIQWLQRDHRVLRGAYTIIGLSETTDELGFPIETTYEFQFSDPNTAFAFKMQWG